MPRRKSSQNTLKEEEVGVIPPGKIKCYITGKLRKDTPEEHVRQEVARSLVEEYGYEKKNIEIEFGIQMGRAQKRADIAIFPDRADHLQENIYLLVEVKNDSVKPSDSENGIPQLESYVAASLNCKFALWVGSERLSFNIKEENGQRILFEISDVPKFGETTIPRPTLGSLVPAIELKQVFKRVHNYIYANQGIQKDAAFEEVLKLIFIKVYDEQFSPTLQFYYLPDEDVDIVRKRLNNVFQRLRAQYEYIFHTNETINLNDSVLIYAIREFQRFSFLNTDIDVKGEAYETIVGPNLRGDRGEFFTPRNVCKMTIEILFSLIPEEHLTSPGAMKILDPAIGTGGFLIAGLHEIKKKFIQRGIRYDQLRNSLRDVSNTNFFGIDFNPFLAKVAQMNMVMNGDGSSNIYSVNSLEEPGQWDEVTRSHINFGTFDIVITNPPFGSKTPVDDQRVLHQYKIQKYGSASPRSSLPPEQLFVERCLDFLKPGGYLGIVLPDSILSNPGLIWLRDWIFTKAYIIASIDLPQETFEPHTGTQTSILILKKKTKEEELRIDEYSIFMTIPEKVGHDKRGNPVYKITPDGEIEIDKSGNNIIDDDLQFISDLFKKWIKEKGMV